MSIFMTLRIALKALNRNKMRTILTMLGMIIGVGAVITMVALGRGAQADHRGAGQVRRHQHDQRQRRQLPAGRRPPGPGHVDHADARRCRRRSARCRACSTSRPASNSPRPGHRRQPELVHAGPGHRRRPAADPQLADQVRRVLHAAGRQHRGEGRRARHGRVRHAVRPRRRSDRTDHPHPQPAVQGHRRDGEQGSGPFGPGPGRHDLRALHDRAEEAAGHAAHQQHHGVGGDRRHRARSPKRSPRRCASATSCRRASRTTSWSARWRRWPASAPRRRGR